MDFNALDLLKDASQLGMGGAALYMLWKIAGNHLTHIEGAMRENTAALFDLKAAIVELSAWVKAKG